MNVGTLFILAITSTILVSEGNSKLVSGTYSVYSVNTGALVYSDDNNVGSYVYGLPAYYVDKYSSSSKALERAAWDVHESSYSSNLYFFKNKYTGLCLSFLGVGYQVAQDNCSFDKGEQLWEIKENTPGDRSYIIKSSAAPDICMYSWPGDSDYYVYTDRCDSYRQISDWAFIPIMKRGYYNP